MADKRFPELDRADVGGLLSDQFAALEDTRPIETNVHQDGDRVDFSFGWPFAPHEKLLAGARLEALANFRRALVEAVAPSLAEVLEATARREVSVAGTSLSQGCARATFSFLLGPATGDQAEERAAIRNWSAQLRRQAKVGRLRHHEVRAEMVALSEEMRRRRVEFEQQRRGASGPGPPDA